MYTEIHPPHYRISQLKNEVDDIATIFIGLLNEKSENKHWVYKIKPKYVYVDFNNSGKYMIDRDTGSVYTIKKYGAANRDYIFADLFSLLQYKDMWTVDYQGINRGELTDFIFDERKKTKPFIDKTVEDANNEMKNLKTELGLAENQKIPKEYQDKVRTRLNPFWVGVYKGTFGKIEVYYSMVKQSLIGTATMFDCERHKVEITPKILIDAIRKLGGEIIKTSSEVKIQEEFPAEKSEKTSMETKLGLQQKIPVIEKILHDTLPKDAWRNVFLFKGWKEEYVQITFAANDYKINNIEGQYPQRVSLVLDNDNTLQVTSAAGVGGQKIWVIPNSDDPKEKFYSQIGVKIPFRKPKKVDKNVFEAIKKFAERWVETLKENRDRLKYQDIVDYDALLGKSYVKMEDKTIEPVESKFVVGEYVKYPKARLSGKVIMIEKESSIPDENSITFEFADGSKATELESSLVKGEKPNPESKEIEIFNELKKLGFKENQSFKNTYHKHFGEKDTDGYRRLTYRYAQGEHRVSNVYQFEKSGVIDSAGDINYSGKDPKEALKVIKTFIENHEVKEEEPINKKEYDFNTPVSLEQINIIKRRYDDDDYLTSISFEYDDKYFTYKINKSGNYLTKKIIQFPSLESLQMGNYSKIIYSTTDSEKTTPLGSYLEYSIMQFPKNWHRHTQPTTEQSTIQDGDIVKTKPNYHIWEVLEPVKDLWGGDAFNLKLIAFGHGENEHVPYYRKNEIKRYSLDDIIKVNSIEELSQSAIDSLKFYFEDRGIFQTSTEPVKEEKIDVKIGDIVGSEFNDNYYEVIDIIDSSMGKKYILRLAVVTKGGTGFYDAMTDENWIKKIYYQDEIIPIKSIKDIKTTALTPLEKYKHWRHHTSAAKKQEKPIELTSENIQESMDASPTYSEEQSKILAQAEKEGYIRRPSHTQSEWTDKGADKFFKKETPVKTETPTKTDQYLKGLDINEYDNHFLLNKAIEELLDQKETTGNTFTAEEKNFISFYSGYGGLEKYGAKGKGLLYEYFTPLEVVKKMWGLAYKYGYNNGSILEPSCGVGEFLKFAPTGDEAPKTVGYEINEYSAKICKILYPDAEIITKPFETKFIKRNKSVRDKISMTEKYDLVIGNPPYGKITGNQGGKYFSMGEDTYTKAQNYIDYFLLRSLDSCVKGGLVIMIIGAQAQAGGKLWLSKGMNHTKQMIIDRADLLDAYRLPNSIFERTGVISDIVVLRKK